MRTGKLPHFADKPTSIPFAFIFSVVFKVGLGVALEAVVAKPMRLISAALHDEGINATNAAG
jgi:hypothetical protein